MIMGDIAQLVYTGTAAMQTLLPRTWFYPAGFGTLGCALPDAIGAKLALPEANRDRAGWVMVASCLP